MPIYNAIYVSDKGKGIDNSRMGVIEESNSGYNQKRQEEKRRCFLRGFEPIPINHHLAHHSECVLSIELLYGGFMHIPLLRHIRDNYKFIFSLIGDDAESTWITSYERNTYRRVRASENSRAIRGNQNGRQFMEITFFW